MDIEAYINWLDNFMKKHADIDDVYFVHENKLAESDENMIRRLSDLYRILDVYTFENFGKYSWIYDLKYQNTFFQISDNGEGYTCKLRETSDDYINYDDLKTKILTKKI